MMWRAAKLIVEVDGWEHHRKRSRFEADRQERRDLRHPGLDHPALHRPRSRDEPYAVIAEIALMLGRRLEAAERAA